MGCGVIHWVCGDVVSSWHHRAVESGLKYKYFSSWKWVLRVLSTFYEVAGQSATCQKFMMNVRHRITTILFTFITIVPSLPLPISPPSPPSPPPFSPISPSLPSLLCLCVSFEARRTFPSVTSWILPLELPSNPWGRGMC